MRTRWHHRKTYWILLSIFFSFLPISTTILGVSFGAGMLVISLPLSDGHYLTAGVGFLVATVILCWIVAPLAYRFLSRAFPLRASAELNRASLRMLRVALGLMLLICLSLVSLCGRFLYGLLAPSGRDLLSMAIGVAMSYVMLTLSAIVLMFSVSLTYGLVKVIAAHRRPGSWTGQGFVLFLRTFGSVSDSAALGPLVWAAGVRLRVALLSSPRQIKASWNPLTLAISGFRFRHPFRTVPVFLESTDATWAEDVRRLAAAAEIVVIDTTHRTPGLSQEIDLLARSGLHEKMVRFEELSSSAPANGDAQARAERVVLMERSRVLRRLSQALGFTFTYLGFVVLTALLVTIFDLNWSSRPAKIMLWSSLLYSMVPAVWGAAELAPTAGFTRRSARRLGDALKAKGLAVSRRP